MTVGSAESAARRCARGGRRGRISAPSVIAPAVLAIAGAPQATADPPGNGDTIVEEIIPPARESQAWAAGIYMELDGEGGLGGVADLTWSAADGTQLSLGASYADSASNLSGLSTRGVSFGGAHDFGPLALDLWYEDWKDPDLIAARAVNGSLGFEFRSWTVSLRGQARRSAFEEFTTDALVTLPSGQQVGVVATADCDLDNTGFGLHLGWRGAAWRAYARGMGYSYSDTQCSFDSRALDYLARTRPAVFRQFAARVTEPLSASAITRIGSENALLERSLGTGVSYTAGRLEYALDYVAQEEHFNGLGSGSVSGSLAIEFGPLLQAVVTTGVTDGDSLDSLWFGGFGLRASF